MCTLGVWLTGDTTPHEINVAKKHGNLAKRFPRSRIYRLLLILLSDMNIQFYADIPLSKCNYIADSFLHFTFSFLEFVMPENYWPMFTFELDLRDVEVLLSFFLLKMTLKVLWMCLGCRSKQHRWYLSTSGLLIRMTNILFMEEILHGRQHMGCGNPPQDFHHWTHLFGWHFKCTLVVKEFFSKNRMTYR